MSYHARLNVSAFAAGLPYGPRKLEVIREKLREERAIARTGNEYDRGMAERNIEDLEAMLTRHEEGERIRAEQEAAATAKREAAIAQVDATSRESFWRAYALDHPNTERAWFDQHYAELVAAHQAREARKLGARFRL